MTVGAFGTMAVGAAGVKLRDPEWPMRSAGRCALEDDLGLGQ